MHEIKILALQFSIQWQKQISTTWYSLYLLKSPAFLTYAVHVDQSCERSSLHLLDAVLVDPHLNQRGRQVLGNSGQHIPGEVELLHVLQRHKCFGVDFGNQVIPQRQTLETVTMVIQIKHLLNTVKTFKVNKLKKRYTECTVCILCLY